MLDNVVPIAPLSLKIFVLMKFFSCLVVLYQIEIRYKGIWVYLGHYHSLYGLSIDVQMTIYSGCTILLSGLEKKRK